MAKRISKPQHIRQVLGQQINGLLEIEPGTTKERIDIARAIAYLSSVALTAINDGEMEERIAALEAMEEERHQIH
ncbi:hypothetical protein ACIQZG_20935 [Lysinibacillus sp. NPDC096418]|uniref:hypothetical protein n=1 Tax=Lysinibacillus sp. NPDC096418 TaxID=3364138 RepID=UPI00380D862B